MYGLQWSSVSEKLWVWSFSTMGDAFWCQPFICQLQVSNETALAQSSPSCKFSIYLRLLRLLVVRFNLKFISAIFTKSKILQALTLVLLSTDAQPTMLTMWSKRLPNTKLYQNTLKQKGCVVSACGTWDSSRVAEMEKTHCDVLNRLENTLVLSLQEK